MTTIPWEQDVSNATFAKTASISRAADYAFPPLQALHVFRRIGFTRHQDRRPRAEGLEFRWGKLLPFIPYASTARVVLEPTIALRQASKPPRGLPRAGVARCMAAGLSELRSLRATSSRIQPPDTALCRSARRRCLRACSPGLIACGDAWDFWCQRPVCWIPAVRVPQVRLATACPTARIQS